MPAPFASSDRPSRDGSRQPAGDLQESLEQDGISWEGAILIVGHDSDIPAWLTVTAERFVLSRGEAILLEAPRSWLVPPPLRVHDQQVRVSITPEGVVPGRETTERLLLDVEKGRGPAQQLVAILTRRSRREQFNAEFPSWSTGVGAGPSLPPLPAFEASQDTDAPRGRHPVTSERRGAEPTDAWGPGEASTRASKPLIPFPAPEEEPVEPQSHAARYLAGREHGPALPEEPATAHEERPAKVTSIEDERERRGAGWGIWAGRVAMVLIVAMVGAWFLQDYLPDEVTERLPALIGDPGDIALDAGDEQPRSSDAERGDGTLGAGTDPEDVMPTEAALGIGGTTSEVPDPALETETEPADTSDDTPTPTSEPETAPQESARPNESTDAGNPAAIIFPPDGTGNSQPPDDTTGDEALGAAEDADGGLEQLAPTFTPGPPAPTATEVPAEPTDTPTATVAATDVPAGPTVAPEPTETPVPTTEPTATVTSEPEQTPTATATREPESTSTPEPTQTETPTPTETPSVIPEPAEETTEQVVAETTPEPVLTSQPPSVTEEDPPTQQFASEGIRYSIEGATTGTSLPELPEINEVTYGEWIVLAVEGENWTDSEQIFDMREFTLIADGQPIQLDVGNSWVASLLGYTPAYGNTSATLWAPGEEHPLVLTFLAPLDAESLVLQAGDQQFDLRTILERTPRLSEMRQGEVPEAIEATVTEVIDGETIVIEKDGVEQTVRYLGIDAPDGDDCYAEASGALNRELVEGRTVRIERQATDVDARGNWVRDVWVEQDDGRFALVAHQLVEAGAARADISEPNTRFASWLRGAEAVAQAENRGLWGNCEQGSVSTSVTADVVIAADHRRTA